MDKLRVGILGLGRGLTHLRGFLGVENAEVIGVADRIEARRERAAGLLNQRGVHHVKMLQEYDDLLAMQPDAVVIASNGKLQVEHTIQALEAGCAALSEVPGAYTMDEVVRLRDAVERTGQFYMFAENSCFSDFLRYWRRWYLEDLFGPISLAEAEYLHYLPNTLHIPDGTTLTPSEAGNRPDAKPVWRADQPPIQYLTHDLGPILEVLDDRVVSVSCRSGPWWSKEAPLRSDGQIALFETAKGTLIRILITLNCARPPEHRYRLFGTLGAAEYSAYEGFTRRFRKGRDEKEGWERLEITSKAPGASTGEGHGGKDVVVARTFTDAILAGAPSPIDVYRMAEYTLPGIIANQSAEAGGAPIPIPNLRRGRYTETHFWQHVPLPDDEPASETYKAPGGAGL